jgi:hypothetical protein
MIDEAYAALLQSVSGWIGENYPDANTNVGWGIYEGDESIDCASKIYGHGILSSVITFDNMKVEHEFEPFGGE